MGPDQTLAYDGFQENLTRQKFLIELNCTKVIMIRAEQR